MLDRYGTQVESLDAQEQFMSSALGEAGASSAPASEVDNLVRQIAAEHAIDVSGMLPAVPQQQTGAHARAQQQSTQTKQQGNRYGPLR